MTDWITTLTDWANEHSALLWWLGGISLALLVLTPVVVGWLAIRLPADYFTSKHRRLLAHLDRRPALRLLVLVGKDVLGIILLLAGIAMLITPGQGLLTIVVGVLLIDFPGKFRLERWLVTRQVWRSINWLRKRADKPELKKPSVADDV